MNEIQLSNDLNVITAEIQSYKQIAGQSIFEIGRRLKHVKKNDLVHGEWQKYCEETLEMSRVYANRYITVYDEFKNSNVNTSFGLNKLFQIATLPQEEREKEHITSKGETKTVDEMTVRELQEIKKKLREEKEEKERIEKQLEQARRSEEIANKKLEEAESKEPEIVEKVVEKEVVKEVVPDHIKKRISFLEEKAGDLEKHKSEIRGYEKKKREIENELANLLSEARKIKDSNNKLAQQATLINAISIPVSHLEKKKAEIEQLMKKDIELTNHGLNTLEIKADFLMEMAVKINRYIEGKKHPNKQNYIEAEVIEHE